MSKPKLRILLLNYYWPPSGGPAVQRWLDFSRLLLEHDIETTVVTIDQNKATYPQRDDKLLEKVPNTTKVYTTDTSELFWLYQKFTKQQEVKPVGLSSDKKEGWKQQFARFVRGNIFIPDPRRGWVTHATKKAIQLLNKKKFDVLVTCGTPHSTHLAGLTLKKKFGIPWIADFHDEWSTHWTLKQFYRLPPAQAYDERLEKKVINKADIVISHCQSASVLLKNKLKTGAQQKLNVVYMGYDAELFKPQLSNQESDNIFNIVYTGSIGESYPSAAFFEAVYQVMQQFPQVTIRLVFAGVMGNAVKQKAMNAKVFPLVKSLGYRPHKEVVQLIQNASVLLLLNPVFEGEKRVIPGKLFEYLAAQKPILNIASPDGESAQIIRDCKAGKTFSQDNPLAMAAFLSENIESWKKGNNQKLNNAEKIEKYSRQEGAKKLAEIIKQLGHARG